MSFVTENPAYISGTRNRMPCPFPHFDRDHKPKLGPAAFIYVLRETAAFTAGEQRIVACRAHIPRWAEKAFEAFPKEERTQLTFEDKPSRKQSANPTTQTSLPIETETAMPLIEIKGNDLPDGTYQVILADVKGPKTIPLKDGTETDIFEWKFVVMDGEHADKEINDSSSTATGPRSKLYGWLTALFGGKRPDIGAGFEASDLKGRIALATTENNEAGWPKIRTLSAIPQSMLAKGVATATGAPVKGNGGETAPLPAGVVTPLRETVAAGAADDLPF